MVPDHVVTTSTSVTLQSYLFLQLFLVIVNKLCNQLSKTLKLFFVCTDQHELAAMLDSGGSSVSQNKL